MPLIVINLRHFSRISLAVRAGLLALLLPLAAAAAPTPQFFTYYGLGNAFAEARDHVNLYWAVSWHRDPEELKAQLREARAAEVKAIVHPEFLFFAGECPYSVHPDAAARWRSFAQDLEREGLLETVVAVYPVDEPDLCGVSDGDTQRVIAIIHDEPLTHDKKVAGLLTVTIAKQWGGHYRLTGREHAYSGSMRAYDWVGFDCYGCNTIFSETAWDTVRFDFSKPGFVTTPGPTLYENFKSQLDLARQQVIIVPKASLGGPLFADWHDNPFEQYMHAAADADVVMLLPFTWFDQAGDVQGVRSIEVLRDAYYEIGRDVDFRHPEVSATQPRRSSAVEFYNPMLDHYFVSALPAEIALLDQGAFVGWQRTGETWRVHRAPAGSPARGTPVCRFYGRPEAGLDSHFYSGSPEECTEVRNRFGDSWLLESEDVFQAQLPHAWTGACPVNMKPVYRLFNNRADANHRYTTSLRIRADMFERGWVPEGYGPQAVALCAVL